MLTNCELWPIDYTCKHFCYKLYNTRYITIVIQQKYFCPKNRTNITVQKTVQIIVQKFVHTRVLKIVQKIVRISDYITTNSYKQKVNKYTATTS